MNKTQIRDVIIPELFAPYVNQQTTTSSALVKSGITQGSELLNDMVARGGRVINLPSFRALSGDDEVLDDSVSLTTARLEAQNYIAPVLLRGKAWSANELAGALSGSDPMTAAGDMLADWWNWQERRMLTSILTGIFAESIRTTHSIDITTLTGTARVITPSAILDAKQLLGDAATKLTALAIHSAVYTKLQKDNLIDYIPNSEGLIDFPTYMGYKIIVDDGIVPEGSNYHSYLFAEGAFARGEGVPDNLTPIETARNALSSDDILVSRRAICLHPIGISWTNTTIAGVTPTNAELALGVNWKKIGDNKSIGITMLRHRIA
jgi:hypothetical protein